MVSLKGLILIYRRVSPSPPPTPSGVNPYLFLFEIPRREKSKLRWKQSYRSKASVRHIDEQDYNNACFDPMTTETRGNSNWLVDSVEKYV